MELNQFTLGIEHSIPNILLEESVKWTQISQILTGEVVAPNIYHF